MAIFQTLRFTPVHINANGTTVIFTPQASNASSTATLETITVNTKGATGNTVSVYNDVSAVAANLIAVLDTTANTQSFFYECLCDKGITIVMGTGTAADITVMWGKSFAE